MRSISSREKIEKRQKRNQIIIGVLLIFVMFGSMLGFGFFSKGEDKEIKEKVESNGIEFVEDGNGYWNFEIQGHNFKTVYNGLETENIEADFEFSLNQLNNLPLYYIGGNREEISELIQNIGEFLIRNPAEVCLEGTGCGEGELVRNCSSNILVFRVSEEEEIKLYKEENCVFINAPEGEEIKSVDKIIFKLLGIQ